MKVIRTVRLKLNLSAQEFKETLAAYSNAFNYICQYGFGKSIFNKIDLHKNTYYECRSLFNMPSQLVISAREKSSEALKAQLSMRKNKKNVKTPKCPIAKNISIRYDKNSYSLFKDDIMSLLLLDGRKEIKLIIPDRERHYFKDWKRGEAELFIRNNKVFFNITFSKDISDISPNGEIVGIDRGINNLAVSSNNKFYSGKKVKHISNRYKRQRQKLQKVNSKSAKRHLRAVSARESRFKADVNHCISKQIVRDLKVGDTLVLEDLSKIRKNSNKKGKVLRTLINNWNFYQLELFLKYKAEEKGITLIKVNPAYTSQTCSQCGYQHEGNRKSQSDFCCQKCSFRINADLNAARNIKLKHSMRQRRMGSADVNQPNGADFVSSNVSASNLHLMPGTSPLQASLGEGN